MDCYYILTSAKTAGYYMCIERKHKPDIHSKNGTSTVIIETNYTVLFLVIPLLYIHENTQHTHNMRYDTLNYTINFRSMK